MAQRPSFIQIDDVLVSEEVLTTCFACDYARCKGACCIIGDSGAPLEESETEALERNYAHYSALMGSGGREAVQKKGFFEKIKGILSADEQVELGKEATVSGGFTQDDIAREFLRDLNPEVQTMKWEKAQGRTPPPWSCKPRRTSWPWAAASLIGYSHIPLR